ncbi:MAG: Polysaccharide biosynthesis protein, partial [Pseudomonadota bacterium]
LRLVKLAPATLCRTPSYSWRQGQSDSLAADAFALDLKLAGLKVLSRQGLEIVKSEPRFLPILSFSLAAMACDLTLAVLLRKIRKFEAMPQMQTIIQTGISLLNVAVPIALAHLYPRAEFAHYRIFSIWLSATSALSLTSGFWSLIPYWSVQDGGAAKIKLAWRVQCSSGLLISAIFLILSSTMLEASERYLGVYLSISSAALLPAIFLEQRLCFLQRGLLSSTLVAFFEVLRSGSMLILVWVGYSLGVALAMVPAFLCLRGIALYLVNNRIHRTSDSEVKIGQIKAVLSESLPIGLAAALSTLSSIFDRVYLSRNLSPDAFSTLAAGTISLPIIMFLEQSLVQRSLPKIAQLLLRKMHIECSIQIKNIVEILMRNSIPFTVFLVLFAPEILSLLFSGRYQDAVPAFRMFALTNILSCVPQDIISRAMGRSKRILTFATTSAVLSVLSVIAAFHFFGVYPAIMAGLLTNFCVRVLFLYVDLERLKIALSQIFPSPETRMKILRASFILLVTKIAAAQSHLSPVTTVLISSICLLLILKSANKNSDIEAYPSGR